MKLPCRASFLFPALRVIREQDAVIQALILGRIVLLDRLAELCADLRESDGSLLRRKDRTREEVILAFKRYIEALLEDNWLWEQLERELDREKHGVATLLRRDFPDLGRTDRRLMLLLYAGVGARTAGTLCHVPPARVRVKKHRFLQRVQDSALPKREMHVLRDNLPGGRCA